jgi:hypothetical protein
LASWTNARLIEAAVTIKLDSQTLKVHEKGDYRDPTRGQGLEAIYV